MSRSYKGVRPKKNWVYSVEDLTHLYSATADTVSNWVRDGLMSSDSQRPNLFRGASVKQYHAQRRKRASSRLAADEFKCRACQFPVRPNKAITFGIAKNGAHMAFSTCPQCTGKVQKFVSETNRGSILKCRNPNTTTDCQHETDSTNHGGVGISDNFNTAGLWTQNDRIIYKWQSFAGCHSVKTIDRHLAAIRYFEDVLLGKPFETLTITDVSKVRDDLKRRALMTASDALSSSSIKHTVSHLVAFLDWLLKQDGFKRLPQDLTGYLKLPRATLASAAQVKQKDFPSLDEADNLLRQMSSHSLVDQRARAIFAIAFLGALRADTIASLRVKHVDIDNRLILQDASVVRAKAGKHINIFWFPIHKSFENIVIEWVAKLRSMGFSDEDALFPNEKWLKHRPFAIASKSVPVMTTQYAVTQAFAFASRNSGTCFTPHSAKHCIAAERDARPLTQLERKAWSENMGHENEQITERHYGKLQDNQRFDLIRNIGKKGPKDLLNMPNDTKLAIIDGILELISDQ